ncbi:hypothetical protein HMI55_002351 [Coelomomyces lativittatus]|nr:hypothetical protein HMI55_002351 [Coelomomyces lativittatus]
MWDRAYGAQNSPHLARERGERGLRVGKTRPEQRVQQGTARRYPGSVGGFPGGCEMGGVLLRDG